MTSHTGGDAVEANAASASSTVGMAGGVAVWALVGALCLCGAAFALAGARGAVPDGDVAASWLPPVVMLVAQLAVLGMADHAVLAKRTFHGDPEYVGAMVAGLCAALSAGPSVVWVTIAFGTTMDVLLALFLAFAGGMLNAALLVGAATSRMTGRLQLVLVAACAVGAAATAMVGVLNLPAVLMAAACSVAGLLFVQIQPSALVHVPDEYLLEWRRYMTQRWTVRGSIPTESRPLRDRDVNEDLDIALATMGEGTAVAVAFAVGGHAALCATMPAVPAPEELVGFAAYTLLAVLVLLLKPRTAGNPADRMLMRAAAVVIMAVAVARVGVDAQWGWLLPWLTVALVAVGVLMALVMPALASTFHSILLSRVGDWLTTLGLALALPAAFFAAGAMDWIRGLMA